MPGPAGGARSLAGRGVVRERDSARAFSARALSVSSSGRPCGGRATRTTRGYAPVVSCFGASPEMIGISLVEKSLAQSDCASSELGSL